MGRILIIFLLFQSVSYAQSNQDLNQKIEVLAEEIERLKAGLVEEVDDNPRSSMKVYRLNKTGLSIGGYGEAYFTNYASENQSNNNSNKEAKAEALRAVLYIGYKFNEKWIFNSEIELEHVGEIFNEFMYIDYLHSDEFNFRAGLILMPMGLTNIFHEPIFFPSVQRSEIEKYFIPTTWRELAVGGYGSFGKLSYSAYLVNGFDAFDFSASSGVRGGRKKGGTSGDNDSNQNASTGAGVVALDYQVSNTLTFGGSVYMGQASGTEADAVHDLSLSIYEAHFEQKYKAWKLRGLYTEVHFKDTNSWNQQTLANGALAEKIYGYYLELQYAHDLAKGAQLIPFFRYERYDLNDEVDTATYGARDKSLDRTNYLVGINYKPLPRIVFKGEYAKKENELETGIDEYSLSMGYTF